MKQVLCIMICLIRNAHEKKCFHNKRAILLVI